MANPEIAAIIFGLVSAASWSSGDFSGGFATKSGSVAGVLLVGYIDSHYFYSHMSYMQNIDGPNNEKLILFERR